MVLFSKLPADREPPLIADVRHHLVMDDDMITALLLSAAGAGLLVGFVFSTIAWLRFRQPDAPLSAVFISALFVASPSYFRPEGQRMRRYSAGSFAVAFMALMILFKLHAPE